jgi:hypothetical protein
MPVKHQKMFHSAVMKETQNLVSFFAMHCLFRWHYLREVTIIAGQTEIQFLCLIICKNPWEYWILVQVIVCPTCIKHKFKLYKHRENIPKVIFTSYIPSRTSCKNSLFSEQDYLGNNTGHSKEASVDLKLHRF